MRLFYLPLTLKTTTEKSLFLSEAHDKVSQNSQNSDIHSLRSAVVPFFNIIFKTIVSAYL
jgi:hypothetical protein